MKLSMVLPLLLAAGTVLSAAEPSPPVLKIRIAVPERGVTLAADEHSHFHVVIENVSDQPQNVIDEWNSWGYYDLHFEFTTAKGERRLMEKKPRAWKGNEFSATTLKPHEVLVRDVYLDDTVWSNLPDPEQGDAAVPMRAIFEQQPEPGQDAWRGRIESPEILMLFRRYRAR